MITAQLQRDWLTYHLSQRDENDQTDLPGWLMDVREQASQAATELPVLDRKQEDWRYTSIETLLEQQFKSLAAPTTKLSVQDIQPYLVADLDAYRVVMVNGYFAAHLSDIEGLPEGVILNNLRNVLSTEPEQLTTWLGKTAQHTEHVFTALNSALMNDGVFLHVGNRVELDRPIEIIYFSTDEQQPLLLQPRNLIVLDEGAKATLIERFIGDKGAHYFHNQLTEIVIDKHALLNHYRLQNESREAYHLSNVYLSQQAQSRYHGATLAFGGVWNRTEYHAMFKHEGAECVLNGLSVVGDKQLSDFHLKIHHKAVGCTSRERFKGILYGKGRAVFDGHILVDKQAQKSDAELSNDNLLLTRDAEVDTKPQLEIYADDVKCSHGTTVGELDMQQIFYLRTRGIDESAARMMLCLGFANDVIDTIPLEALRDDAIRSLNNSLTSAVILAG